MNMQIHSTDGVGILEKDADLLTDLKIYLALDCNNFKNQLKIFSGHLKLSTNERAYAYRKVHEWVRIVEVNEARYMEAQMSDKLLFIRINFVIHSRLQMYIHNCRQTKEGDLEPELLDFGNSNLDVSGHRKRCI